MEQDIRIDQAPCALENVLASITDHPLACESLQHDDFVPFLTDNQQRQNLVSQYHQIIASYEPYAAGDNTIKIIQSFQMFLSDGGQLNLMLDVRNIGGDQRKLRLLAKHLANAVLKSVHLASKKPFSIVNTPNPAATASRSRIPALLEQEILKRDGYKCAYTRSYDQDSVNHNNVHAPAGANSSYTRITPIISFALGSSANVDEDGPWRDDAVAMIWSSLHRYFPSLWGKIDQFSLCQHKNLVTFDVNVQEHFETRTIAFQPSAGRPDQYELHKFPAEISLLPQWSGWMTLVSSDTSVPLPDPDFFAVHYQIASILEQSGIGPQIRDPSPDGPASLNPNNSPAVHCDIYLNLQSILPSGAYGH